MDSLIIELITNYGIDGFMAAALVFIVVSFDRRLEARDCDDTEQRRELVDIIKNNTEAMTSLRIIVENMRK